MESSVAARGRIGIVTGAGPEAGIDLWQKVLLHNKKMFNNTFRGDIDAPPVVAHSVPRLGYVMNIELYVKDIQQVLLDTIGKLEEQADYFCMACNILHFYAESIRNQIKHIEFVSIVDPIKKYIKDKQLTNLALLSIGPVMSLGPYSPYRELADRVELESPEGERMNALVRNIKSKGPHDPGLLAEYHDILNGLRSDTVLLACTELPLLSTHGIEKNIIDATDLLAREMAAKSYRARVMDR